MITYKWAIEPIRRSITLDELKTTRAYKKRAASWDPNKWDYTEWEECDYEARRELGLDKG